MKHSPIAAAHGVATQEADAVATAAKRPKAALGIQAKSSSPKNSRKNVASWPKPVQIRALRAKRYELQSVARELLLQDGRNRIGDITREATNTAGVLDKSKRDGLLLTEQKKLGLQVKRPYRHAADFHRTCKCLRHSQSGEITVHQKKGDKKSFYSGLQTCSSVWTCPVCSSKIQERRRIECAQAVEAIYTSNFENINAAKNLIRIKLKSEKKELKAKIKTIKTASIREKRGKSRSEKALINWFVSVEISSLKEEALKSKLDREIPVAQAIRHKAVMVTLTFPHYHFDTLDDLLKKQRKALVRLRSGKMYERFKQEIGLLGFIRTLELTIGEKHSWHPHTHDVMFVKSDADAKFLKKDLQILWEKACIGSGLLDLNNEKQIKNFRKRAVDVKDRVSSSDYIAKYGDQNTWGIDAELTKSNSKTNVDDHKGLHPFALLELADENNSYGKRFVEYAKAMRGKSQLFWSHGLKERLGINDVDDEELASEKREEADVLAVLGSEHWRKVIENDARSEILDIAETLGFKGLQDWFKRHCMIISRAPPNSS